MTARKIFSLMLTALLLCSMITLAAPAASADEPVMMQPCFGRPFRPDGTDYGQVSFRVPSGTQGLTKDAWDNELSHNTDLILVSFVKDGVLYENMTVPEVKAMLGDLPLKRTCYTYEETPDGLYLNLRFHMDAHATLKPEDFVAITVKAGFVWCAGSPGGISNELSHIVLDRDVSFPVNAQAGITAVKTGPMNGVDGALRIQFERKDSESLKAISAVDLCPSAIPGKTLGDLVTIDGITVTELVKSGCVARFNFYGDTMIFHIDNPTYLAELKEQQYEIVILPGFRWMNWDRDDWGTWSGANKDKYTPVEGTLVLEPISFTVNTNDEVCVKTDGISVLNGYKDTYYVGEKIDMTSLKISLNYATGDSLEMMILESMVSYDFSVPGTATVTVEYEGMQATYEVTVLPAPEPSLEQETTEPEATSEETAEPEETEPEATESETTEPETTEPETTGAESTEAATQEQTETTPTSESVPETSSGDLVPEPAVPNGCKSVLLPVSVLLLALSAVVLKKKGD